MPIKLKTVSSMEKCFIDENIDSKKTLSRASALLGEEFSFEAVYTNDNQTGDIKTVTRLKIESPLKDYIIARKVEYVPVRVAAYPHSDDYFLRKTPGLYPDLLTPLNQKNYVYVAPGQLNALYITVNLPEKLPEELENSFKNRRSADFPIIISLTSGENTLASAEFTLHVINEKLPEQRMYVTEWFHCDCIANYYNLEAFSTKHWEYIEKFMGTAARNGINTILTPVFTPSLDTEVGGERLTTQLTDVTVNPDGSYTFGFDKLERWVEAAHRAGLEYFEISHLYTQWGAAHAPKIMATVAETGEYKRIFGWETDSLSDEYRTFLRSFLTALISELKKLGVDKKCLFHISDEPSFAHLEQYKAVKAQISDILAGYPIMDALSDFAFYKTGALDNPIPSSNHIDPFIEAGIPNLWTYYCCSQTVGVSNRMIAMPSQRTRIIGAQFWKYRIAGFLQWGYNFYNSQGSTHAVNPFLVTDGDYFTPAGDCFAVYPGPDGEPYESLHMKAFTMALTDMRALYLAEEKIGRDKVMGLVDEKGNMTFSDYTHEEGWVEELREKINEIIENS